MRDLYRVFFTRLSIDEALYQYITCEISIVSSLRGSLSMRLSIVSSSWGSDYSFVAIASPSPTREKPLAVGLAMRLSHTLIAGPSPPKSHYIIGGSIKPSLVVPLHHWWTHYIIGGPITSLVVPLHHWWSHYIIGGPITSLHQESLH